MDSIGKARKRCLQLVLWLSSDFISRATPYLWWHTSQGNFSFGGKVDSDFFPFPSFFLPLHRNSEYYPNTTICSYTHRTLPGMGAQQVVQHLYFTPALARKKGRSTVSLGGSNWTRLTSNSPLVRLPQHHQHPMLCPVTFQNIACSRITQNWYISQSFIRLHVMLSATHSISLLQFINILKSWHFLV